MGQFPAPIRLRGPRRLQPVAAWIQVAISALLRDPGGVSRFNGLFKCRYRTPPPPSLPPSFSPTQFGRKFALVPGTMVVSTAVAMTSFATTQQQLAACVVLWGMGNSILGSTPTAYMADSTTLENRSQALALLRTGGDIGLAVGAGECYCVCVCSAVAVRGHVCVLFPVYVGVCVCVPPLLRPPRARTHTSMMLYVPPSKHALTAFLTPFLSSLQALWAFWRTRWTLALPCWSTLPRSPWPQWRSRASAKSLCVFPLVGLFSPRRQRPAPQQNRANISSEGFQHSVLFTICWSTLPRSPWPLWRSRASARSLCVFPLAGLFSLQRQRPAPQQDRANNNRDWLCISTRFCLLRVLFARKTQNRYAGIH